MPNHVPGKLSVVVDRRKFVCCNEWGKQKSCPRVVNNDFSRSHRLTEKTGGMES